MGILELTSNYQKCIKETNKIPDYASEYKKEYLLIKGINEKCKDFVNLIEKNEEYYNIPEAIRIVKCLKKFNKSRKIDNVESIRFDVFDVFNIYIIRLELNNYIDLYRHKSTGEFDEERYNLNVESDKPGFKSFYKCFYKFYSNLNIDDRYLPAKILNYQKCIKKTNKITDYARDYRNEYLLIKGINKKCKDFVNLLKKNEEYYNIHEAIKIVKCLKKFNKSRKVGNVENIYFNVFDVLNIYIIRLELDKYIDLYRYAFNGKESD